MTAKRFEWIDGIDYENMSFKDNLLNKEVSSVEDLIMWLNELHEENEQLKQRNNRQAKQLDRLYNLIEQKDWRTLNDILDDFKRCEEQLKRESRTYK